MTSIEKVAYLKGLAEGMEIDGTTKEGKLLLAIVDTLAVIAEDTWDLQEQVDELGEQVDEIDEDLGTIEDIVYEDLDDECDCDCDDCDCCGDWDEEFYDVTCPNCKEEFEVDEETLLDGGIDCPNCGEHLEFDIEEDDESDEEPQE